VFLKVTMWGTIYYLLDRLHIQGAKLICEFTPLDLATDFVINHVSVLLLSA